MSISGIHSFSCSTILLILKSISGLEIIYNVDSTLLADTSVSNVYLTHDSLNTFRKIKKVNLFDFHNINSYGDIQFGENFQFKSQNETYEIIIRQVPSWYYHATGLASRY